VSLRRRPGVRTRSEPGTFEIRVAADRVRDDNGNRLTDIVVTFDVRFPEWRGWRRGSSSPARADRQITRSHVHRRSDGRARDGHERRLRWWRCRSELPRRRPARISKPFATRHFWLRLSPVTSPDRPSVVSGVGVAVTPPCRHPKCDPAHDMPRKPRNPTHSVNVSAVGGVCRRGDLNPHALNRAPGPQPGASANSATPTWLSGTPGR
jgi:hypothetical protein